MKKMNMYQCAYTEMLQKVISEKNAIIAKKDYDIKILLAEKKALLILMHGYAKKISKKPDQDEIIAHVLDVCPECGKHYGNVILYGDSEDHEIVHCVCGNEFILPLYTHWQELPQDA